MKGNLPEHTLLTKGIKSPAMSGPVKRLRGIGHIALLDWDDHVDPRAGDADRLHETHGIDGPTAVLESSPGSFHGWNLTIRPFAKTAVVLDKLNDDGKHRAVGSSRGWWRLRAGPKMQIDKDDPTDAYKPAPELIDVIDPDDGSVISGPHLAVLRAMSGESVLTDATDRYTVRGSTVLTAQYTTFTDLEKPVQRGATDER